MIHSEYTRSLNCNYQRVLLDKKPEEKRYQYCILSRGGVKGLLPCDLRYINGQAYLYYDITSKQNLAHIYENRNISREWLKDFLWSLKQVQQELGRFLLDTSNVLWYPEQIFQDLETNLFCFLYMPYYEGESGFRSLLEFLTEHIDYEDEMLVDCVYHIYEQYEKAGEDYLQSLIFEDTKCLDEAFPVKGEGDWRETMQSEATQSAAMQQGDAELRVAVKRNTEMYEEGKEKRQDKRTEQFERSKKGLLNLFEGKRNRNRRQREEYRQIMHREMAGYVVAEDPMYKGEAYRGNNIDFGDDTEVEHDYEQGEYGRTIFVEAAVDAEKLPHRLLLPDGRLLATLDKPALSIGKKKEEVDLVFEEASVSRMHARITMDKGAAYLEDLNSTNGTFKNGLRLQPYEKRKLDEGDEIKCGRVAFIFR